VRHFLTFGAIISTDRPQRQEFEGWYAGRLVATILCGECFVMTDRATAIKRDVFQLVELQIETLRQEGRLSDSALIEYHARSEKITELYHEIDREVRERFDWRSARAS
jgi:hypothetical protein